MPLAACFSANPREVLKRVLNRYSALGLTPVVAVELEFYLLDAADRRWPPADLDQPGHRRAQSHHAGLLHGGSERLSAFHRPLGRHLPRSADSADTAVAEYAPGQFEINLKHRADALQACDDAIYLKGAIKAVAGQQQMLASFMANPLWSRPAAACISMSACWIAMAAMSLPARPRRHRPDAECHRQDAADVGRLHADLRPHANSYRRFVLNAFVPLNDCWGFNNRTVAMRIPHSDAANARIEHRIAGADANLSGHRSGAVRPACSTASNKSRPRPPSSAMPTNKPKLARCTGGRPSANSSKASSSPNTSAASSASSTASRN